MKCLRQPGRNKINSLCLGIPNEIIFLQPGTLKHFTLNNVNNYIYTYIITYITHEQKVNRDKYGEEHKNLINNKV